ncbi:MAG: DNA repair protein RecO [Capsulimonadaceae bacterium]
MPSYNANAVVIRRLNFSETDKILTLFSREHGKFSAIAKGARKAVSRLSGATEVLTCTRFCLASGKSMDIVTQAEVHESFPVLRQDLVRLAHGLYLADLVDHCIEDHHPNPALFDLLLSGLTLVQEAANAEIGTRWFELKLLTDLGYRPDLEHCAICRCRLVPEPDALYALSATLGGALCPIHGRAGAYADHSALNAPAMRLLQDLTGIDPDCGHLVARVPVPDTGSLEMANLALRRTVRYRLEHDLKSLTFLDSLRQPDSK